MHCIRQIQTLTDRKKQAVICVEARCSRHSTKKVVISHPGETCAAGLVNDAVHSDNHVKVSIVHVQFVLIVASSGHTAVQSMERRGDFRYQNFAC